MKVSPVLFLMLLFLSYACARKVTVDQDLTEPTFVKADLAYKDVYKPLDGIWEGTFYIYEHQEGQIDGEMTPDLLNEKFFLGPSLKIMDSIAVRQEYQSHTPYYQTVDITDIYVSEGDTTLVKSNGVNKIERGKMWCVVQKPDEKIVHAGTEEGDHTIIWSRNESSPLHKEYFREKVSTENYQIVGYGYYGSDDTTLMPKTWFLANYHRVSDYLR